MVTQRYAVVQHPVESLLTWVKSGEIAIPEIQRPFVWDATKVRNFLDSLYRGYPVGYLIAWRNPNLRLKDGTLSAGKRILIDGQQRVTALMAALLGQEVLTRDYEAVRIRIAFHPMEERFEVSNPAIQKDGTWIADLADIFSTEASLSKLTRDYVAHNPAADQDRVSLVLEELRKITNNQVGLIELAENLDIENVSDIFIRVNSAGAELNQADFVMSKIAANHIYGGNMLRRAIDYFCHMAVAPDSISRIEKSDEDFANSEYFAKMSWLRDVNDDLYDPSYTDMLRVAFTSEFRRGKLQDLVALLSGRNFETRQYEEAVAEDAFNRLKTGVLKFINKTQFDRLTMILRSAGFVTSKLIRSRNAVNFAYIIYLLGRAEGIPAADIERLVRRWYVMSLLLGRYSGSIESAFERDISQVETRGLTQHVADVIDAGLSESFWTTSLPQALETSSRTSPFFHVYQAAQVKLGDLGFLSRDITVRDLLLNRSDVHHVYPRNMLKKQGLGPGRYNQIANFVLAQSEINISIGDRSPAEYFAGLAAQCSGGPLQYGGITDREEMRRNLAMNCLPECLLDGDVPDYDRFLAMRRTLMAEKIRIYFKGL